MSTSWWRLRKSQGISKISRIHPLRSTNVQNLMAIHPIVVEIIQSGPKCQTIMEHVGVAQTCRGREGLCSSLSGFVDKYSHSK